MVARKTYSNYSNSPSLTYGDMLNILLSNLFPSSNPAPRNKHVSAILCSYNPRAEQYAQRLFKLLREWGADPRFLRELEEEFKKSVEEDKRDGCIPIYSSSR